MSSQANVVSSDPTTSAGSRLPKRITGLVLVTLALASFVHLFSLDTSTLEGDPGPQLFPAIATAGLGLCGVSLLLFPGKPEITEDQERHWKLGAVFFLLLVSYTLLMQFSGYWISTPLFVASSMLILTRPGQKKWVPMIILAVVVTVVVGYLFSSALNVILP